jgi:peptide/nickel transport system substrate-binding protein
MGTAPDYLDPQEGYTTQAAEPDWITYTPLLTYRHAAGKAGTELIPGLAQDLPKVSKDGRTYTLTLRKGLFFSNGRPVRASDFTATIERAIRLNWGGKSFFTNYIAGASAFDRGDSNTISGIETDNATGKITIHLTTAYGAFDNVLAFPAAGLVPSGTPAKNLSNDPPPGVGPYMITDVSPNRAFTLVKNPRFASLRIPGRCVSG